MGHGFRASMRTVGLVEGSITSVVRDVFIFSLEGFSDGICHPFFTVTSRVLFFEFWPKRCVNP